MQSHASRHVVSEHLADRHPYTDKPFEKVPRQNEIAVAFGDRNIPKLVGVLNLAQEQLLESDRVQCLQIFKDLLSTQETKVRAVQAGAMAPLLAWLCYESSSTAVRQLCCRSIGSICQLKQGRDAFFAAGGIEALTTALVTTPDDAVVAMQVLCSCVDGSVALLSSPCRVLGSLLELIERPGSSYPAATAASLCVAALCDSDEGVTDALACQAPRLLGQLACRVLQHSTALSAGNAQLLEVLRAAAAAMNVISHHADGKTKLRLADCIPVLAQMLGVADMEVQGSAASCLAALTIEVASKLPIMEAAAEQLVRLVREGKDVISVAARTALLSAAEHLDARRKLELLLPGAERNVLLGLLSEVPPDYKYVVWKSGN